MAKRAKKDKDEAGVSALRGNGFDPEKCQSFVERIENLQDEIYDAMAAAMEECEPLRADIKSVKDEARGAGITKREFNAILSKRRTLRRAEAFRSKLDEEQANNFDQLESALGMFSDSPLGKAALSKAKTEGCAAAH